MDTYREAMKLAKEYVEMDMAITCLDVQRALYNSHKLEFSNPGIEATRIITEEDHDMFYIYPDSVLACTFIESIPHFRDKVLSARTTNIIPFNR